MDWAVLEKMFNRAFRLSLTKRKAFLVFPILILCGLITVIFRSLFPAASRWVQMSLGFLPFFLCAGILLCVGMVLIRIYHHEVRGLAVHYIETIRGSTKLFLGVAYLATPLIFIYLIFWIILGIFYLLQSIPAVGTLVGAILSFGPFLLVFGSIILAIANVLILFFVTPAVALTSNWGPQLAITSLTSIRKSPFRAILLTVVSLLPVIFVVGLLLFTDTVTQTILYLGDSAWINFLTWLITMIPFSALLTPVVIFFFNFSAESYSLFAKDQQVESD